MLSLILLRVLSPLQQHYVMRLASIAEVAVGSNKSDH